MTRVGGVSSNVAESVQKSQIVDSGGEAVTVTDGKLDVNATVVATVTSTAGPISDGVDANIKATVKDLTNSNPLTTTIVDGDGTQMTSFPVTNAGITTIAGAVSDNHVQVDVVSAPSTTVTATNLDVRDLTSVSDSVEVKQGTNANLKADVTSNAQNIATETTVNSLLKPASTLTKVTTVDTITNDVGIKDNGNTITVDGTVNANISGNIGNTSFASTVADGADVTLGAKADNRSTATDTTAVSLVSLLKQISYMEQNPASRAVTNAGTFAVQAAQSVAANLNCTEASASNIKTAVETIDNAIAGTEMQVDVVAPLPAGTNAIGKLAANSGVDIGDIDVASIAAGNNNIGDVDVASITAGTNVIGKIRLVTALGDEVTEDTGDSVKATLQAGTAAVGKLAANDGVDIGDVTINNSTGAAAVNVQDGGNTITVDGSVTADLGANNDVTLATLPDTAGGDLADIETNTDSLAVVGGGAEATAVRVTLANDSTGVVSVDDNAGALTVDGTVTANLSTTDNAVLDNIDTATTSKYITGIVHGVKTVTTAGTDVALAASTACKKVTIQAQTDNTNIIAVGGSGVDATVATGTGVVLYPGDVFELDIDNLADVYIDSLVNGEGVRFVYFT